MSRLSLFLLVAAVVAPAAGLAADSGFLLVDIEPNSIVFGLREPDAETLSVRILDRDYNEVLNTGPVSAGEITWDLSEAALDGVDIEGGGCYRTYESQVAAWNRRRCYIPGNCDGDPYPPTAEPGTSLHGWGLDIDVWGATDVILGCSAPELLWLQINAPRFGWVNPEWARCGRPGAEPWHWEYVGSEFTVLKDEGGL